VPEYNLQDLDRLIHRTSVSATSAYIAERQARERAEQMYHALNCQHTEAVCRWRAARARWTLIAAAVAGIIGVALGIAIARGVL